MVPLLQNLASGHQKRSAINCLKACTTKVKRVLLLLNSDTASSNVDFLDHGSRGGVPLGLFSEMQLALMHILNLNISKYAYLCIY